MATTPSRWPRPEIALAQTRLVLGPGETDTLRVLVPAQGNREIRAWSSGGRLIPAWCGWAHRDRQRPGSGTGRDHRHRLLPGAARPVLVHRRAEDPGGVAPTHSAGAIQVPVRAVRKVTAVAEAADSTPIPEARVTGRWATRR